MPNLYVQTTHTVREPRTFTKHNQSLFEILTTRDSDFDPCSVEGVVMLEKGTVVRDKFIIDKAFEMRRKRKDLSEADIVKFILQEYAHSDFLPSKYTAFKAAVIGRGDTRYYLFDENITCTIDNLKREIYVFGKNFSQDNFIGDQIQKARSRGVFYYDGLLPDALFEFEQKHYLILARQPDGTSRGLSIAQLAEKPIQVKLPIIFDATS